MTKTDDNLREAFAGESQANRRYLFFAEKAEKEGLKQVARLFRAAAEAETIHAKNHFNAMDGVGTTIDNLSAGVIGEHLEFTRMYPTFIDTATEEGNARAQKTFEWANAVEERIPAVTARYAGINIEITVRLNNFFMTTSAESAIVR